MSAPSRHVVCPSCGAINRIPANRPAEHAKCGTCHQPVFAGKPVAVRTDAFERHVRRDDIPVVVDFWAPWCGPYKAMAPAYERAAVALEPGFRLLKVNADEEPMLSNRYEIRGIPTLMLFSGGTAVARTAGAMDTAGIVSWVKSHAPGTAGP